MPGIPTQFTVADLVLSRLVNAPVTAFLTNPANRPFFYLGAIGPTLGDFLPSRPDAANLAASSPYYGAWQPILQILAGDSTVNPPTPSFADDLRAMRTTLDRVTPAIEAKDVLALARMQDELGGLTSIVTRIQTIYIPAIQNINNQVLRAIQRSAPRVKVGPSSGWFARDTLLSSHTGSFATTLLRSAEESHDDRRRAYAIGYVVAYATNIAGAPFVNSIVGAPSRLHWWRCRAIANYVDTWVHGFYELVRRGTLTTFTNDVPAPAYTTWPNVNGAKLHVRIELGGVSPDAVLASIRDRTHVPVALPPDFVDGFWLPAYRKVYGDPAAAGIDAAGVHGAYALTYLVLWLQTSGEILPSAPPDRINLPDNCGDRPDWVAVDGSVLVPGQPNASPPPKTPDKDPDIAELLSALFVALLAVLSVAARAIAAGALLLFAAAKLAIDGAADWAKLLCHVRWNRVYFDNLGNAMLDLLVGTGLAFPYTQKLAFAPQLRALGIPIPFDAAPNTTRSRLPEAPYPAMQWPAIVSDWWTLPTGLEAPAQVAYPFDPRYPSDFVDGNQFVRVVSPRPAPQPPDVTIQTKQQNPLFRLDANSVPLVHDKSEWTRRRGRLGVERAMTTPFGNAVDISLDLIAHPEVDLLDWDLAGDRGVGFPTWQLPTPTTPPGAPIPEP
jgi:hypothetical protein